MPPGEQQGANPTLATSTNLRQPRNETTRAQKYCLPLRAAVTDPVTDQETAFAHLVLSGTMTDRRAAEAVGLNPEPAPKPANDPRCKCYRK